MKKTAHFLIFALLLVSCLFFNNSLYKKSQTGTTLSIPSLSQLQPALAKTLSLEFNGITADYLFIHVLTFMGEKVIKEQETTQQEWAAIHRALQTIINLDPRATDPYILAATTLPWEAGLITETNKLLEKIAHYQPDDYRPYLFLYYNHYNFLNDMEKAGFYLEKAAAIPGAPSYFKPLASRMYLYSGRLEASIVYTMEVIKTTQDEAIRKYMQKRLKALRIIDHIETKIREFEKRFNKPPNNLTELVSAGIMETIPKDPYGGDFIILENGRVYSTSKLVDYKSNKSIKK